MLSFARTLFPILLTSAVFGSARHAAAQAPPVGDPAQGKVFFQQSCALCHADALGAGGAEITKQGPSLIGVLGRGAGSDKSFNFTKALSASGLTWGRTHARQIPLGSANARARHRHALRSP